MFGPSIARRITHDGILAHVDEDVIDDDFPQKDLSAISRAWSAAEDKARSTFTDPDTIYATTIANARMQLQKRTPSIYYRDVNLEANPRYGKLMETMERQTRCVDDMAIWDEDITTHWWRIIRYLDTIARNGIIISPQKFEFCAEEIEFAGFRVTATEVKPLAKYLEAIKTFPRPTNISNVRSWFGLVNQVAHYARLSDMLAPFKPYVSPKVWFQWNDELELAFNRSRLEIVAAIRKGVEIFDPTRTTVLSPDWSKTGIGYFLYQKHCECPSTVTTCCDNGWRVTLAGSRFLSDAEKNYWPTEGEALGVAWSLEDTKFFTLGCTDLHVQTDHRPLVKLLGDRTLDEAAGGW